MTRAPRNERSKARALAFNALSGATFLVGGLLTYALSFGVDVSYLIPFAAGSFLYIGAADLVPEVNKHASPLQNLVHLTAFLLGVAVMYSAAALG